MSTPTTIANPTPDTAPQTIAPTQAPPAPVPHERLLNMIQGLAVGLGAAGKAIATGGREGGVADVQAYQANQQQMALKQSQEQRAQQQAQQQISESQSRISYQTAQSLLLTSQLHILNQNAPLEHQKLQAQIDDTLIDLADKLNIPRSFSVPYIAGQSTEDHIKTVENAAGPSGGLGKSVVTSAHAPNGAGFGSGEGQTVGHSATGMFNTVIPPDDPRAKQAIDLTQQYLDTFKAELGGDNKAVKQAQSKLDLIAKTNGQGMSVLHFGTALHDALILPSQAKQRQGELQDFQEKQSNTAKTTQEAIAATRANQPPTPQQVATFTNSTLPSYTHIPQPQKTALAQEISQARTATEANQIEARADATEKSGVQAQLTREQTAAMKGVQFEQKMADEALKPWTDPMHGFNATANQLRATKQAIQAGEEGNGMLASMAPTMVVLGVNSFNQTHRISPAEAQAAGMPGSFVQQFNTWADRVGDGKLNKETAAQGQQIMDLLIHQKHQQAIVSSAMAAKTGKIPLNTVYGQDLAGNITTLDKIPTQTATSKKDGKMHLANIDGKDLGVAP